MQGNRTHGNVKTNKNTDQEVQVVLNQENSKSQKIKNLFQLGLTIKEVSVIMNVRYNFVYNVISNQVITDGIKIDNTQKINKKDLVREQVTQGKSIKEIAIDLKTNYNYIYKLVKEIKNESETITEVK